MRIKKFIFKILCFALLTVLMFGQYSQIASALSPEQLKIYQEGINYYDVNVCGDTGSSGSVSVTAGNGTPTGLQFPNLDPSTMANVVNEYIKKTNPDSKLNNLGATLVASAKNANINPFLVVAIAQQESNLSSPSDFNVSHGSNSFGRTANPGQPSFQGARTWYYWPSVKASVDYTDPVNQNGSNSDETQFLVDEYGSFIKDNDLPGLVKKYDPAPSEYQKYIPDVTSWIKQMADMTGQAQLTAPTNSPTQGGGQTCCPPSSISGGGSVPTSLTGGDNQTKAYNFFLQVGLSPAQAVGVVANLVNESSVNPLIGGSDPSSSPAFGIAQWTPGSKFATDKAKNHIAGPDGDLLTQLQVLWAEMNGKSDPSVGFTNIVPQLEKINNPGDAAVFFRDNFERCDLNYSSCSDRGSVANTLYPQLSNGSQNGVLSGGSCVDPSASPNCQTVTGNAKILCAAKQFDTVSYSQTIMGGNHLGSNKTWLNLCTTIGPSCYLDCSGLVNIAVYEAFGYDLQENTTAEASDTTHWKHIQFDQLQPGDLIQPGGYGGDHVEIVDHVSGNTIYAFGAHNDGVPQPQQVGPTQYPKSAGDIYLHWVGPGAS